MASRFSISDSQGRGENIHTMCPLLCIDCRNPALHIVKQSRLTQSLWHRRLARNNAAKKSMLIYVPKRSKFEFQDKMKGMNTHLQIIDKSSKTVKDW